MFTFNGNLLNQAVIKASPNVGDEITPEAIVIHFTAGGPAGGSITWLCNKDAGVSAHLVIDRNGDVTQLVPFNRKAFHAGNSSWVGRQYLNGWSIGIEHANWGKLTEKNGKFYTYTGTTFTGEVYTDEDGFYWEQYSEEQLKSSLEVCKALCKQYQINYILGHSEISPGRKIDPGPHFPLKKFREECLKKSNPHKLVYGDKEQEFNDEEWETLEKLFRLFI